MASKQASEAHLLSILRSHCIPLGQNEVSWAFSSNHSNDLCEYIAKYLGEETLLSLEESDSYNHLSSAVQKSLRKSTDISLICPRSEEDFRLDTADIKLETEMLRRQTRMLREQKAALKKVKNEDREARKQRREDYMARQTKWNQQVEQLRTSIDDLLSTVSNQVSRLQETHSLFAAQPAEHSRHTVESVLESDDTTIAKIESMADTNDINADAGEDLFVQEVEQLASQLSNLVTSRLRIKLDHTFVEAYNKFPPPDEPDATQIDELENDLEGLQAEIPGVARMIIEEKYVQPLIQDIRKRKALEQQVSIQRAQWMAHILTLLASRLSRISEALTYGLHSSISLSTFIKELSLILNPPKPSPSPSRSPNIQSSPTKTPRVRRSQPPEQTLLAHLGIPLPTPLAARTPGLYTPGPAPTIALSDHLTQQTARLTSKLTSLATEQKATSYGIAEELSLLRAVIRIIRDEVEAEVDWNAGKRWEETVLGQELADRLDGVDAGAGVLKGAAMSLAEVLNRVSNSRQKQEFVGRWARE